MNGENFIKEMLTKIGKNRLKESNLDNLIKQAMKRFGIKDKYFDKIKKDVELDYEDSDINQLTERDIAEIIDASENNYEKLNNSKELNNLKESLEKIVSKNRLKEGHREVVNSIIDYIGVNNLVSHFKLNYKIKNMSRSEIHDLLYKIIDNLNERNLEALADSYDMTIYKGKAMNIHNAPQYAVDDDYDYR